jgi:hypothetical protein
MSYKARQTVGPITEEVSDKARNLLDVSLFLASLKKPKVSIMSREESINMLKQTLGKNHPLLHELSLIIDTFDTATGIAMKIEKFFREELASKASLQPLSVQQVLSIMSELNKLHDDMFEFVSWLDVPMEISKANIITYLEYPKDKGSPGLGGAVESQLLPLQQLYAKKDDIKQGLEKISAIMRRYYGDVIESIQYTVRRLHRLLAVLMDLFYDAKIPIPIPGPWFSSRYEFEVRSLDTYERIAKQLGLNEVAEQLEKLGNALFTAFFDPNTANIYLDNKNIGEIYDKLQHIVEDIKKSSKNLQISDRDLRMFVSEVVPLITEDIYDMVGLVVSASRHCRDTKDAIARSFTEFKPGFNSCTGIINPDEGDIKKTMHELMWILFFNEIAFIAHRLAEMGVFLRDYMIRLFHLENLLGGHTQISGCDVPIFTRVSSGPVFDFATAWLNTVCALINNNWVSENDKRPLSGYIMNENEGWFRVGSSFGHATHIEKKGDTWVVRYYDNDAPVNETLAKLWSTVPNTKVEVLPDGVVVETNDKNALPFLGALLGFATSMDLNFQHNGVKETHQRMMELANQVSPQLALLVKTALGM